MAWTARLPLRREGGRFLSTSRRLCGRPSSNVITGQAPFMPARGALTCLQHDPPIIVVGAGVAGVTAALALRRAGHPVRLFEKRGCFRGGDKGFRGGDKGSGIGLWGPALQALRATVGVDLSALVRAGRFMKEPSYRQATSGEWIVRPHPLPTPVHGAEWSTTAEVVVLPDLRACLALHRSAFMEHMRTELHQSGVHVETGHTFVTAEEHGGTVVARFLTEHGLEVEVRGSLLLGADGINSAVRARCLGDETWLPEHSGYVYHRALVPAAAFEPALRDSLVREPFESWAPGLRFGMVPLGDSPQSGQTELFWFGVHTRDPLLSDRRMDYQWDQLREFHYPVRALVNATPPDRVHTTDIHELAVPLLPPAFRHRRCGKQRLWSSSGGRVVLLGDACHATPPNLAQGACLSIEDAAELAAQLMSADLSRGDSVRLASRRYEQRRWLRAVVVQRGSRAVDSVGRWRGAWAGCRDRLLSALPPKPKMALFDLAHRALLGWTYTAPAACVGPLYERLLGTEFFAAAQLSQEMLNFHRWPSRSANRCSVARGRLQVSHGNGVLVAPIMWFLGMPSDSRGEWIPMTCVVRGLSGHRELWTREFAESPAKKSVFETEQGFVDGKFVEDFGLLRFVFSLVPRTPLSLTLNGDTFKGDGFRHQLLQVCVRIPGTRICVPLPSLLAPRVTGQTVAQDCGWVMCVRMAWPSWIGRLMGDDHIIQYAGHIESVRVE